MSNLSFRMRLAERQTPPRKPRRTISSCPVCIIILTVIFISLAAEAWFYFPQ